MLFTLKRREFAIKSMTGKSTVRWLNTTNIQILSWRCIYNGKRQSHSCNDK
ncbi:protein of unknown function [Candidatus Nitrosocosmicus franklandus]|uniref:Uncharacterized protein n=1 Tax=Candidatus Nitrosocosmicus franklandianus TaxID=1798806 RepID=A0A484IC37_9ARCH|nr:protein of unknown function [Candidatus Nitrosocosmicus franklandus]